METKVISFSVPGVPKGKGRPRFARIGNFVRTYTPKETASYENLIKVMFLEQAQKTKFKPLDSGEACSVFISASFQYPKSMSRKAVASKPPYTKKPDCDNIAKIVCDSLNGVAWADDSQIISLTIMKQYISESPQVSVMIARCSKNLLCHQCDTRCEGLLIDGGVTGEKTEREG